MLGWLITAALAGSLQIFPNPTSLAEGGQTERVTVTVSGCTPGNTVHVFLSAEGSTDPVDAAGVIADGGELACSSGAAEVDLWLSLEERDSLSRQTIAFVKAVEIEPATGSLIRFGVYRIRVGEPTALEVLGGYLGSQLERLRLAAGNVVYRAILQSRADPSDDLRVVWTPVRDRTPRNVPHACFATGTTWATPERLWITWGAKRPSKVDRAGVWEMDTSGRHRRLIQATPDSEPTAPVRLPDGRVGAVLTAAPAQPGHEPTLVIWRAGAVENEVPLPWAPDWARADLVAGELWLVGHDGARARLMTVNLATHAVAEVTAEGMELLAAGVSPDGRLSAYGMPLFQGWKLKLLDTDSEDGPAEVSPDHTRPYEVAPAWKPDSLALAWLAPYSGGRRCPR